MRSGIMLLATLALAGCDEQAKAPAVAASSASATAEALVPAATPDPAPTNAPASLIGEWRVAGIDGQPLDGPIGLAVSIDDRSISAEPPCAGFVWNYRYTAGSLEILSRPEKKLPPGCTVAPQQTALDRAISAATRADRTPANGVELSGGGHSLLLFSQ